MDPILATTVWDRIKRFVPPAYTLENGESVVLDQLNDHWRYSWYYRPQAEFPVHRDGINVDEAHPERRSVLTLNIFLNDEFQGGGTEFFTEDGTTRYVAEPKPGRAALFYHRNVHAGNPVSDGSKFLLRTDVWGT